MIHNIKSPPKNQLVTTLQLIPMINTKFYLIERVIPYGYCYHRDYLTQNLLFDKAVVGTGDFLNLIGLEGVDEQHLVKDRFFKNTSKDFIDTYINCIKRIRN